MMIPPVSSAKPTIDSRATDLLWAKAQALEATFLSEMLGYAGVGEAATSFGGGVGEEQFESFLRQEQATAIVRHGGLGLAESLFHALTERANDRP